jgi:glutamine amidotransferase
MVALLDYGAGNLASVRKGLHAVGIDHRTPACPDELDRARGIVVPGVGHFSATAALGNQWREAILARIRAGVPLLGICLGMQWLFEGSAEAPDVSGLGVFQGLCTRIVAPPPLKVPHVGWNTLSACRESRLLQDVPRDAYAYFTHSFAAPLTAECVATTTHGTALPAAVEHDRIWGVQFHPEKSATHGLQVLQNFARMVSA